MTHEQQTEKKQANLAAELRESLDDARRYEWGDSPWEHLGDAERDVRVLLDYADRLVAEREGALEQCRVAEGREAALREAAALVVLLDERERAGDETLSGHEWGEAMAKLAAACSVHALAAVPAADPTPIECPCGARVHKPCANPNCHVRTGHLPGGASARELQELQEARQELQEAREALRSVATLADVATTGERDHPQAIPGQDWRESDAVKRAREWLSFFDTPLWYGRTEVEWAGLLRALLAELDFTGEWLQRCLDAERDDLSDPGDGRDLRGGRLS